LEDYILNVRWDKSPINPNRWSMFHLREAIEIDVKTILDSKDCREEVKKLMAIEGIADWSLIQIKIAEIVRKFGKIVGSGQFYGENFFRPDYRKEAKKIIDKNFEITTYKSESYSQMVVTKKVKANNSCCAVIMNFLRRLFNFFNAPRIV
ncbi:MAG: hypothetical protein LBL39_06280, partial [Planctomycetaceae bacterium]|jgi:hypothetical protein|nr:hypothetical protein [Planctomycetaceae bacterium]